MKDKNIEQILKESTDKMPVPNGNLIYDMPKKKSMVIRILRMSGRVAATVCMLCIILLSGVFTVNAEFRNTVISIFKVKTVEVVPSNIPDNANEERKKEDIIVYRNANLDDIFSVECLQAHGRMQSLNAGIFHYKSNDGKSKFYKAINGRFEPVSMKKIYDEVTIGGITSTIDYSYCLENNEIVLYENKCHTVTIDDENEADFYLEPGENKSEK